MKKERAIELFEMVKRENLLPGKIDELIPLSFIGQAAVTFYRQKVKTMDRLNVTEAQKQATLKDGQDAGEMLLEIEKRIGELIIKQPKVPIREPSGKVTGSKKSLPDNISKKRSHQSQQIDSHPEIVEKIKAQARENDDIPTKTAVLSEIRYQKEKERRKEAEGKQQETRLEWAVDQLQYIRALDKCARTLPKEPPKDWNEDAFEEAMCKVNIIIQRMINFPMILKMSKSDMRKEVLLKLMDLDASQEELKSLFNLPIKRIEKFGDSFRLVLGGKDGCEVKHTKYPVKKRVAAIET